MALKLLGDAPAKLLLIEAGAAPVVGVVLEVVVVVVVVVAVVGHPTTNANS